MMLLGYGKEVTSASMLLLAELNNVTSTSHYVNVFLFVAFYYIVKRNAKSRTSGAVNKAGSLLSCRIVLLKGQGQTVICMSNIQLSLLVLFHAQYGSFYENTPDSDISFFHIKVSH